MSIVLSGHPLVLRSVVLRCSLAYQLHAPCLLPTLAASIRAANFAEALELAPSACLDYFDAMYRTNDPDGEFSGYSIVNHVLLNEIDSAHAAKDRCAPFVLLQPYAVIEVALKHKRRRFLSQPIVYASMRQVWVGGGYVEDFLHIFRKVVLGWFFFGWLAILVGFLVQAICAMFPPFGIWYERHFRLRERSTIERQLLGLGFVPAFRYLVCRTGDIILAISLTTLSWMPFVVEDRFTHRLVPVYGFSPSQQSTWHNLAMIFVFLFSFGGVIEEGLRFVNIFFGDLDLSQQWNSLVGETVSSAKAITTHRAKVSLRKANRSQAAMVGSCLDSSSRPSPPPPLAKRSLSNLSVRRAASTMVKGSKRTQLLAVMGAFFKAVTAQRRWRKFIDEGSYDALLRVFCLVTWFLSLAYGPQDLQMASRGLLHPEMLLSFTVILLWLRQIQILEVFQTTGPMIVILNNIWRDVVSVAPSRMAPPHTLLILPHGVSFPPARMDDLQCVCSWK